MSLSRSPRQYMGVRAILPPDLQQATRNPTSSDKSYVKGTLWLNTSAATAFMWPGSGNWIALGSGSAGGIVTLTGGSGGALTATAGNFNLLGTASQITSTGSGSTITFSIPSAFIAPGSVTATTTLTATLGSITATNGNFTSSTAGKALLLNSGTTSGTTTSTLNGRVGQVTITTPSIAAGATFVMTISNTSISGSSTQVGYWLTGGTTGSALTIQSYANTSNQSVVTIQNGTGATTNTASLILNFLVIN